LERFFKTPQDILRVCDSVYALETLLLNKAPPPPPPSPLGWSIAIENSSVCVAMPHSRSLPLPTFFALKEPGAVIIDGIRFLALLTKNKKSQWFSAPGFRV
jgi:hypothetical protein